MILNNSIILPTPFWIIKLTYSNFFKTLSYLNIINKTIMMTILSNIIKFLECQVLL